MAGPIPLSLYLLGPLALALVARRLLRTPLAPFWAGVITFFLAWLCVIVVTQAVAASGPAVGGGGVAYTIVLAAAAGLLEETGRFAAFQAFPALRGSASWRTGLVYALGHSGMESVIVGASLGLTAAVVAHRPELLTPDVLASSRALLATGTGGAVYTAVERVLVGALMHACFTLVVLLGILRRQGRYLGLAILWHFVHDLIALNLGEVTAHWMGHATWIAFILVIYSWLLIRLVRSSLAAGSGASPHTSPAGTFA
jgi:uncharacterized membrane protein YhfC